MRIVIFFINIGFYHVARIRAAAAECKKLGWDLSAVQLTGETLEHPWGVSQDIGFPLETLLPKGEGLGGLSGLPKVPYQSVEALLARHKPDVVFLPGWSFDLSRKALRWSRLNTIPAVVMSESKRDDEPRLWLKEILKSWFYVRKFSGALVGSDLHAQYIQDLGIPEGRVFTGYDAVDNDHFREHAEYAREHEAEVRSRYSNIPERPFFLIVTRLMPRKNIIGLLHAYVAYRQQTDAEPWDMVICGSGEQQSIIEEMIRSSHLEDSVLMVGFLTYHEIGYWYGLAHAFVHPALNEQWGLVVNEACAAGLPILCSQTVGSRYDLVRDDFNGYLFDPKQIADMTECLLKMHRTESSDREKMGLASQSLVDARGPAAFGRGLVAVASAVTDKG
ncbi:MAG: glycosyltransferase family 4 protein [Sedimenticola sp.]